MIHSHIQRTVHGHPADPASTRDLTGISPTEMQHLDICIRGAIRESQGFDKMTNSEIKSALANANEVGQQFDLPNQNDPATDPRTVRQFYRHHLQQLQALQPKLEDDAIRDITPDEYSALISAVQVGYQEAVIYRELSPEQLTQGIAFIQQKCAAWGIPAWDHYDPYLEQAPEFFTHRADLLAGVLFAINQPYPECDYAPPVATT